MIFDRVKNMEEIVGNSACSLIWPLSHKGWEERKYLSQQKYINTNINCQPTYSYKFSTPLAVMSEEPIANGFLTRMPKEELLHIDEIETGKLYSHQLPDYYGKYINEIIEIDEVGICTQKNEFNGKRFVVLLEKKGKIIATLPKEIGQIPFMGWGMGYWDNLSENFPTIKKFLRMPNRTRVSGGEAIEYSVEYFGKRKEKVIGLWYTDSNLERIPPINLEDAWDTAMLTFYSKELEPDYSRAFKTLLKIDRSIPAFSRPWFIWRDMYDKLIKLVDYEPKHLPDEEKKMVAKKLLKEKLMDTSRNFADVSDGKYLGRYNLHDYIKIKNGEVQKEDPLYEDGDDLVGLFGGPQSFLDMFREELEERFSYVEFVENSETFDVLFSDEKIEIN